MATAVELLAHEWLRLDKDLTTRAQIQELLDEDNQVELEKRLRQRIAFGTAGLRAPMEAGFSRMNAVTVIQASQGLAAYVRAAIPSAASMGIVVGYDARHHSKRFAALAAAAFVAQGIKVWWYEELVHTPLVPFGVREFGAAAGVMVTASHNPAHYNGYKVYWSNACQIISPHDANIAASILSNLEPVSWDDSVIFHHILVEHALQRVIGPYFAAVEKAIVSGVPSNAEISFVYTPMHGVGLPYMQEAAKRLRLFGNMAVVQEQASPDPNFPTVKFPNPEEAGALDRAIDTADRNGMSLVVATDPDADRLAVAQKFEGIWHQLTGNQLGILLASRMLSISRQAGTPQKFAMLNTAVSTAMLRSMAEVEGVYYEETLTGFKWLGNKAIELESQGYDVRFAFEEAIGYMIPSIVHDKDGISAAAFFLDAARSWKEQEGLTAWEKLQQLYERYGYFETANTYLLSPDPARTAQVFALIREREDPFPSHLGRRKILRWKDLTVGYDSGTDDHVPTLPAVTDGQMIWCELEGSVKLTMRSSGTEPKIKVYIECQAGSADIARAGAREVLDDLYREWLRPEANGLLYS